jgi:potassium/hydrogen antiporter
MDPSLVYLTSLSIVLIIGIICTIISSKLKIPNILLLLGSGLGAGLIIYRNEPLIFFPNVFLSAIGTMALAMIVFDSCSRFKWKEFDTFTYSALKLSLIFLIFNFIFLTASTYYLFNLESVIVALIFSALMTGTSPDAVAAMFKEGKGKVVEFLEVESILNTPLVVLLPYILIELHTSLSGSGIFVETFIDQVKPFITQFAAGIGTGFVIGLLVFKIMKNYYSEELSALSLFTTTILTYILAENLGGSGVLAVTVMGLLYGNMYVKQKGQLTEFSEIIGTSLMILVFVLIGVKIQLPTEMDFFIRSLILYAIYTFIRIVVVFFSLRQEDYTTKEKIFMGLNMPKGIAVAVIAFSLAASSFSIKGLSTILDLTIVFILYSVIISTIFSKFGRYFLGKKPREVKS